MDAVSASAIAQSNVNDQVMTAVARKSLDAQKAQGQAAISLLQQAAQMQKQLAPAPSLNPSIGANLNVVA